MKRFAEYHTHTKYSDGKMTMEEIVQEARRLGLERIGISDHGYKHMGFGVNYKNYPKMKDEIESLREKYQDIEILLGVEANILDKYGNIDVDDYIYNIVDYVLAGYHFGSNIQNLRGARNHFCNYTKIFKNKEIDYNTEAIINTIKNNNLLMITHPGDKGDVEIREIALEAAKKRVALEVNCRHKFLSDEQLLEVKDIDNLRYIVGTDAHKISHMEKVESGINRLIKAEISVDKVLNCR